MQAAVLFLLRAYKWALSPLLPPACRYVPTCSEYAVEAVDRYGVLRGGSMAVWRLLRCHPFVKGGFDPVPCRGRRMGVLRENSLDAKATQGSRQQHSFTQHVSTG